MSRQPPGTPPRPEDPPRPWGAPATAPGFPAAGVPEAPAGLPPAAVPAARQEGRPPTAVPWAADPGAGGGAGTAPATGRLRRIAQDLPDWEPLPPGEVLVRRRGAGT